MSTDPNALWERFARYLEQEFDFSLPAEQQVRFQSFLDQLKTYNAVHNLVSARDDEELLFRHIADSLAGIPVIRRYLTDTRATPPLMADLGSGGGFPGLPLCIAIPELRLTSVESVGKKCVF